MSTSRAREASSSYDRTETAPGSTLSETAYRRLRSDIISCQLAPGDLVTERGLAQSTGMGLSAVRSALTRLDQDGLVQTLPRQGYLVTPLTVRSIEELFDVWQMLGPELISRGTARATSEQMARLRTLGRERMDTEAQEGRPSETALHRAMTVLAGFDLLAECAGNEYLFRMYRQISGDLTRLAWLLENEMAQGASGLAVPRFDRVVEGDVEEFLRFVEQAREQVREIIVRLPSVMASEIHR